MSRIKGSLDEGQSPLFVLAAYDHDYQGGNLDPQQEIMADPVAMVTGPSEHVLEVLGKIAEQTALQPALSSEARALGEDHANRKYFWQTAGAEILADRTDRYGIGLKRTILDFMLAKQLERYQARDDALFEHEGRPNHFPTWLPETRKVATATSEGMPSWIRGGNRIGETAAGDRYKFVEDSWRLAVANRRITNRGMTTPEDAASYLDIKNIRADRDILNLMGDQFHRCEIFGTWPARNTKTFKDRRNFWRGMMLASAESADDKLLLALFNEVRSNVRAELHYWTVAIQDMDRTEGGKEARNAIQSRETRKVPLTGNPMLEAIAEERAEWVVPRPQPVKVDPKPSPSESKQQIFERADDPGYTSPALAWARVMRERPPRTSDMTTLISLGQAGLILEELDPLVAEASKRNREEARIQEQTQFILEILQEAQSH